MSISRGFLVVGTIYLTLGMTLGIYMSISHEYTFTPVHAHLNLLGFTLMSIFALVYHNWPELQGSVLAKVHFWLHQIAAIVLLPVLFLVIGGWIAEETVGPFLGIASIAFVVGTLCFLLNVISKVR